MKKLLILSICFLSLINIAEAQYVNIPDSNFRSYLITQIPACFNGAGQMDTTCSGVLNADSIFCSHASIKDLTGIQYFKSLSYLNCSNDSLAFLDTLPNGLKTLNCSFNSLTSLPGTRRL